LLLEVLEEAELCDVLARLAFPEVREEARRALSAALAAMLRTFAPPERWSCALAETLAKWVGLKGARMSPTGATLRTLLLGVGKLLPVTSTAIGAARDGLSGRAASAALLCQLLERLVFPLARSRLALRLARRPGDSEAALGPVVGQAEGFLRALRELERGAPGDDGLMGGQFDLWAVEAGGRHYVIFLE